MKVFFSKEWLTLVEASFRNFLAEAIQHLPLPTLLRFDTDRLQRSALQKQVEHLQTESAELKQQLTAYSTAAQSAHSDNAAMQQSNQHKNQARQSLQGAAQIWPHSNTQPQQPGHDRQIQQRLPMQHDQPSSGAHATECGMSSSDQQQSEASMQTARSNTTPQPLDRSASETGPALSLSALELSWSASLDVSAHADMVAHSGSQHSKVAPDRQSTAGQDTLSLDTDASSPRMLRAGEQPISESGHQSQEQTQQSDAVALQQTAAKDTQQQGNGIQQQGTRKVPSDLKQQKSEELGTRPRFIASSSNDARALSRLQRAQGANESSSDAEKLPGHEQGTSCCSFSPSGQNLATASADGVVRILAPASIQVHVTFLC